GQLRGGQAVRDHVGDRADVAEPAAFWPQGTLAEEIAGSEQVERVLPALGMAAAPEDLPFSNNVEVVAPLALNRDLHPLAEAHPRRQVGERRRVELCPQALVVLVFVLAAHHSPRHRIEDLNPMPSTSIAGMRAELLRGPAWRR